MDRGGRKGRNRKVSFRIIAGGASTAAVEREHCNSVRLGSAAGLEGSPKVREKEVEKRLY